MKFPCLHLFRLCSALLACCVVLPSSGCIKDKAPKVLETAYVRGGGVPLRDQLGPASGLITTLQGGEKVDVLAKRARWVQVRLAGGRTGWLHSRYLVAPEVFDEFRRLDADSAGLPSQGKAALRRETSLHLEPGIKSDSFYNLKEGQEVEVLEHRLAERAENTNVARRAEDESEDAPPAVEITGSDDWFLVRASASRTGWVREGALDMKLPIEIARYNEGLRVRAWFVLYEEIDDGETHPWYLWATIHPRPGLPFDYDEIRVFVWNPRASRYETSYRERNLIGFYPIQAGNSGQAPSFSLQVEDESGKRFRKNYVMNGRLVKRES
jgi:hypothetical protein